MNTELLDNPAERRKQVRLSVRPDLQISEQRYEGKVYHVVKDPICLRYYRFNKQEYFVFSLFDGKHNMEDVRKRFEDEFKPHRLEFQDLESFARQLVTAGLVQHEAGGAGKHLFQRRAKQRRTRRIAAFTNILYWKIPVFDPDRILTWMYGYLWWIFTWPCFLAAVGLMLAAAFHVLVHFQAFYDKMPRYQEFFAFHTVLYMWLSLGVVKVIHEFGHGLSCKAFKGECHEMGVLLMCLSPALYCNVTDAWTVADKWKRIIISFAGIYVELVIAAIATFVWWYTPHLPTINSIAMCLMVLCSVSTVMFNANPLMRFDGYYMMADWLEIPNLRDRSNKYLTHQFQEKCLGIEVQPEPYMAPSRRALFVTYAVTSYVYRWTITFSIIWMLSNFLGPQLKILSQMLAFVALASMFIWPIYRMAKNIHQRGRLPDMKAKRVYATAAVAAGLVVAFVFVPLPVSRVLDRGLVTVDPGSAGPVGLIEPAFLTGLHVQEGQTVQQGQLIATFDSRELREQRDQAATKRDQQRRVADSLRQQLTVGDPAQRDKVRLEADQARDEADAWARQVDLLDERLRAVSTLTAPRDGVVMGLPRRSEVGKLFDRNFQQGRPICTVGDPSKLIVRVPISAVDYKLLAEDMPARGELTASVYVAGRTDHLFTGMVRRLPQSDAQQVPYPLTQRGGGPVAVKQSGEGGQEVTPVAQVYLVEVELEDPDATVRPGVLVDVKIHCQWRSGAWWVKRKLSQVLDIGLY
ncbi:MAG TPA: biotin/lipoyl-binding protein [Fimbriiglobus sp.]|nr:biotin/lipoyl-binding protein [Fimbriiglobus sp.]